MATARKTFSTSSTETKLKTATKVLRPLGERVLIQVEKAPTTTPSGLHLPDSMQKKPHMGKIVALGEGVKDLTLGIGSVVYFQPFAGFDVPGMDDHVVMKTEDLLIVEA